MLQQEIIEGNKLIAEWLGYQILHKKFQFKNYNSSNESYFETDEGDVVCDEYGHEVNLYPDGDPLCELSELPFDSSWDWLIPIINKIYENDWYYKWKDTSGQFEKEVFINTKFIETTWEQVVEFIKWYNENKNK